jgi:hypothetical protein
VASDLGADPLAGISPFSVRLIDAIVRGNAADRPTQPAEGGPVVHLIDPASTAEVVSKSESSRRTRRGSKPEPLGKSILNILNGNDRSIERLAFETDPQQHNVYGSVYRGKHRLLPDTVLKRIAIQDDLVAAITNTRAAQIQTFGRPQPDRYSTGFKLVPDEGVLDKLTEEERDAVEERIDRAQRLIVTCGHTSGLSTTDRMSFSQYLGMSTRNAVTVGRIATEFVYAEGEDGEREFHHFRPIDAGTIYKAAPQREAAQAVRDSALRLLEQLKNEEFEPERFENDEYAYVQVLEGRPVQAFTEEECVVRNFYPVTDVELDGYPVTPIDTAIAAVTTHINITTHNRLYFQHGRASRGMLVITSDDVSRETVSQIKHQFQASINNVGNSWRMPVFAVGAEDTINYVPIDAQSRDMEFQYLSDSNARVIMSAYQISPEELPGYQHLSKGTNNQALSECLDLKTRLITRRGLASVEEILGGERVVHAPLWTGTQWADARVFLTGPKRLVETKLGCGISLQTSPDHRFWVVGDDGLPRWRRQEELAVGDPVLVSRKPVEGVGAAPSYCGRELTLDMMEVLGWLMGDGCLVADRQRAGAKLELFYHHEREADVWERHEAVLAEFGLPCQHQKVEVSAEEQEKCKARYWFKSCAPFRLRNVVYNTDFYRWLTSLGFESSEGGKVVPAFVFTLPIAHRAAFLRGLFSADGGKANDTGSVVLTVQDDRMRDLVRQLLLGMGIRCLPCEGYFRESFGEKTFSYKLHIKDRQQFWDTIGFVQKHKQLDGSAEKWAQGNPPQSVVRRFLGECALTEAFRGLGKSARDGARAAVAGTRKVSWNFLRRICAFCGVKAWFDDYNVEEIADIWDSGTVVEMADVSIATEQHAFYAEGAIVHNSNNEWKLEAARDVGIRPLVAQWEDFLNDNVLPLIDPQLAKFCVIKFVGLDADTPEKEVTGLQEAMGVHLTYDEVLQKVEKKPVGAALGGQLPLNPMFLQNLDKYFTVGEILERFCGVEGAAQDPMLAYRRDPFWFQQVQLVQQQQQVQQQAAAAQPQQGGGPPPDGGAPGGQPAPDAGPQQGGQQQPAADPGAPDLATGIDQVLAALGKSEAQLPPSRRRLLEQHRKTVDLAVVGLGKDLLELEKTLVGVAERFAPRRR